MCRLVFSNGEIQLLGNDVDVALFLRDTPTTAQLSTLSVHLDNGELPCPGKGLDLIAFDGESVGATPPLPEAIFGFITGPTWRTELTGAEKSADLLVDLFVLRQRFLDGVDGEIA